MDPVEEDNNVGIAMSLTVGAGAATALGAAVVFFPRIVKMASRRVLAASLGFSAGVMTYVSFVEIFRKSRTAFVDSGLDEDKSDIYACLCFFGGVVFMMFLNFVVTKLLGASGQGQHQPGPVPATTTTRETVPHTTTSDVLREEDATPPCCAKDPVHQLEEMHRMADELEEADQDSEDSDDFVANLPVPDDASHRSDESDNDIVGDDGNGHQETRKEKEERKRLVKMGLNTALAIALHNFPEGLATFVAALNDPSVGAVLAFAIAIHNIPEGLCVALPIFYATGNRCKAFWWAVLSGASEIVAALLGWAVLASTVSDTTYAILFGVVAGMMVIISIRELLPTAHHYDPDDTVVTNSFIFGMAFMAFSLVLFLL